MKKDGAANNTTAGGPAKHIAGAAALLAAIALPQLLWRYELYNYAHLICLIGIYIILALGLNVIIGYTGILNLGYAAFYGIGAYTAALLSIHLNLSFWALLPLCGLASAAAGMLVAIPTLRLRGDYIAIVTLGFVEIVRIALNNLDKITNGPKGLPNIGQTIKSPQASLAGRTIVFNEDIYFFYLILFFIVLTIIIMNRLHNSRVGRSWVAIREDEIASEVMGINTTNMKVQAFGVSAFFAGVAGCIYTHWIGFITPELFTFWESVLIVCTIVLGGIGSVPGVIIGAILIVGTPEALRNALMAMPSGGAGMSDSMRAAVDNIVLARMLIFGLIMILMVIFRPQGIFPAKRPLATIRNRDGKGGSDGKPS